MKLTGVCAIAELQSINPGKLSKTKRFKLLRATSIALQPSTMAQAIKWIVFGANAVLKQPNNQQGELL